MRLASRAGARVDRRIHSQCVEHVVLQGSPGHIQVLDSQSSKADYAELVFLGHDRELRESDSTSPGLSVQHSILETKVSNIIGPHRGMPC